MDQSRIKKAAFGLSSDQRLEFERITNDSSIFTAELAAIRRALQYIQINRITNKDKQFVIFCDSKSVVESIENQESKNPIMINILDTLQDLWSKSFIIRFVWIPSHVGIQGNEDADDQAKLGLSSNGIADYKIPYTDYIPVVKSFIRDKWQQRWRLNHINRGNKLYNILPVVKPFYMTGFKRKDEVVLHRIRIGHTRLTHSYLMEGRDRVQPQCFYCDVDLISIKHLMLDCLHFKNTQKKYFTVKEVLIDNMKDLFEKIPLREILGFLKEAGLYNLI